MDPFLNSITMEDEKIVPALNESASLVLLTTGTLSMNELIPTLPRMNSTMAGHWSQVSTMVFDYSTALVRSGSLYASMPKVGDIAPVA